MSPEWLDDVPKGPGVFLLRLRDAPPYLAKTGFLRKRLLRLTVGDRIAGVEYWPTASRLESSIRLYDLAREHFPDGYLPLLRLRMPFYVKLALSNRFPRSQVTSHFSSASALYFGPFRSRLSAERLESQVLDLFQIRRCQDDLEPSPTHPGCMYGEMAMCLRPCQQVVSEQEYASEVERIGEFFRSSGKSLLQQAIAARDDCSGRMQFEDAARMHKRVEKIEEVLKLPDEVARPLDSLNAVAIAPSTEPGCVNLGIVREGHWQGLRPFRCETADAKPVSLDARLREVLTRTGGERQQRKQRQEYLAIFARWAYSSWRDGELILFESFETVPYRKLVNAVSRVLSHD